VLRLTSATILALLALAAPAAADRYDVLDVLGDELARVDRATPVPLLLPDRLDLDFDGRVFAFGDGTRRGWSFTLTTRRRCGANACFLATLDAQRGGELAFARRVRVADGVRGSFKPLSCGASCSPPALDFVRRGVRYSLQAKLGVSGDRAARRALLRAARAALAAGPR
jgi:hypothetical protein